MAWLAGDPQVGRKAGAAMFAADIAQEYGFTDVDGRTPHFWRKIDQRLSAFARA